MQQQPAAAGKKWSVVKKLPVLFVLTYLFLYMFPFPFDKIPGIKYLAALYVKATDLIITRIGKSILGIHTLTKIEETGSGDTTFDYVRVAVIFLISLLVACLAFALTRRQNNYEQWRCTLTVYARYYLGLYLITYGLVKIFEVQFTFPNLVQLERPYGNSSPMGLLWTFMGYSRPYTMFTGLLEMIAGALLFFRKTTALGCLFTIIIMLNVVMLNFCYDVPVKLFSTHLLLIAVFIVWPDVKTIYNFFIRHQSNRLTASQLTFHRKWLRVTGIIVKYFMIVVVPVFIGAEELGFDDEPEADKSAGLSGVYKTEVFVVNKDTLCSAGNNVQRWSKMIIEANFAGVTFGNDSSLFYDMAVDTTKKKITITSYSDSTSKYFLSYKMLPNDHLFVSGLHQSDSFYATFKRKVKTDYPLVHRGFHWLNEDNY